MVLMLSWYRMFSLIPFSCASMKYLVHIICDIASSAPTRSASVELRVLIFCFFYMLDMEPLPMDMVAPVCPQQSPWVAKEASTHHLTKVRESALGVSGKWIVQRM
jgi:hypothetical protein